MNLVFDDVNIRKLNKNKVTKIRYWSGKPYDIEMVKKSMVGLFP